MADDEFAPFADMIEAGEMPVWGFRLLVRIDDAGVQHVDFLWAGQEVHAYTAVGALEAAKLEMFNEHYAENT